MATCPRICSTSLLVDVILVAGTAATGVLIRVRVCFRCGQRLWFVWLWLGVLQLERLWLGGAIAFLAGNILYRIFLSSTFGTGGEVYHVGPVIAVWFGASDKRRWCFRLCVAKT
jgi:hypothetical protein